MNSGNAEMKTSELTGAALDWAVAQCEGYRGVESLTKPDPLDDGALEHRWLREYSPSTNWAHGGPLIEREGISVMLSFRDSYAEGADAKPSGWCARKYQYGVLNEPLSHGPAPLIAAMRCYVASKLGDEVDVPEALNRGRSHEEDRN
jgi:hypothetical protein